MTNREWLNSLPDVDWVMMRTHSIAGYCDRTNPKQCTNQTNNETKTVCSLFSPCDECLYNWLRAEHEDGFGDDILQYVHINEEDE